MTDAASSVETASTIPGPADILTVDEEAITPGLFNEALQNIIPEDLEVERNELSQSRRSSESNGGDEGNALKRKLAQRATSHGPEQGDTLQNGTSESSKRVKDDGDDKPRATKRSTPPRTPEAATPEDVTQKRHSPPVTPPPSSSHDVSFTSPEPLKRPREDAGQDDNPRQTKRPSPPPEQKETAPAAATPKLGGFMAYASTSSPFASVKGQNIFGGGSKTSIFSKSPSPSLAALTSPFSKVTTRVLGDPLSSIPMATKRSGFEAFASSTSHLTSTARAQSPNSLGSGHAPRSKSPGRRATASKNLTAFTSYATGGAQGYTVPMPKRTRTGSPYGGSLERSGSVLSTSDADDEDEEPGIHDGQLSFGEKLRAGKDSEDVTDEVTKPEFTSQEVSTGEEDEKSVYMVRAKLFCLDQNQWRERGTGTLKLNVRLSDGEGARLVMRKEAVFTLLLNVPIFSGMSASTAQDPRYVRLSAFEGGQTVHYNLRVASAKMGEELLDAIKTYATA